MDHPDARDATALLAAEEAGVRERRRTEVDGLTRLLAWCDLHSVDPQTQPGAVPVKYGGPRLIDVGGAGTPQVSDLCFAEFAIAAQTGDIATTNKAADALDLRHRLPLLWACVCDLRIEVWAARKIARLSRFLSPSAVAIVDECLAGAADLPPGRLLELAEARIIEADPETHRERIAKERARTGVFTRRRRAGQAVESIDGQADVAPITLRLPTAGAIEFTTTVEEIAQVLAEQHSPADDDDHPTMDQWRARAVELLADPFAAVRLLQGPDEPPPTPRPKRHAVIHVHLSATSLTLHALGYEPGMARVEGLGPFLADLLGDLLRNRDIHLKPIVDLNVGAAVDAYEHPVACKERSLLRTGGDVFPYSTSRTRRLDHDHATPYDATGPPGQTGDHNDAPLTRRHHRAKTHLPYELTQLGLGAYRWETPHGLTRVVTARGTVIVEPIRDDQGKVIGEIYPTRIPIVWEPADSG